MPGAFPHLPKFSDSFITDSWTQKWKLFTGVFEFKNLSDSLVIFLVLISFICCFLNYALGIFLQLTGLNWVVCDSLVVKLQLALLQKIHFEGKSIKLKTSTIKTIWLLLSIFETGPVLI